MSRSTIRRNTSHLETLEGRQLLANVVVNTVADTVVNDAFTSLREAVALANAATTPTNITFAPSVFNAPKSITLAGSQLRFTNRAAATTITGPAAGLTLDAAGRSRHAFVNDGVTVNMSNLTFTNGAALGTTFTLANPSDRGGSIENQGRLTIRNSTFVNNRATRFGGAINEDANGVVTLINVTMTGNSVSATGGHGGAISVYGEVNLYNVTISGNSAPAGGGINVNNTSGKPFRVANSIIAGNTTTVAGAGDAKNVFTSLGGNIIGKTDGSSGWLASDQKGTVALPLNPRLNPLANNGGPTRTKFPQAGSPAVNRGVNALVPPGVTTDQRGATRVANVFVDVGAVERPGTSTGAFVTVANGSFETPIVPTSATWVVPTSLPGWQVTTGLSSINLHSKRLWPAQQGNQHIELDSPGASLSQTLTGLTVGSAYSVSFAMAGNPDRASIYTMRLNVDQGAVSTSETYHFTSSGKTRANPDWTTHTLGFVATSTSATIRFTRTDSGVRGWGPQLDNVRVTPGFDSSANQAGIARLQNELLTKQWNYFDSRYPSNAPLGGAIEFFANGKFSSQYKWNYWIVGPRTMHVQYWDANYAQSKSVVFTFNETLTQAVCQFADNPSSVHNIVLTRRA